MFFLFLFFFSPPLSKVEKWQSTETLTVQNSLPSRTKKYNQVQHCCISDQNGIANTRKLLKRKNKKRSDVKWYDWSISSILSSQKKRSDLLNHYGIKRGNRTSTILYMNPSFRNIWKHSEPITSTL